MTFEYEARIRELIKLIIKETDREKLKVLAAELDHLLSLEKKPWRLRVLSSDQADEPQH
jgi:hypothetical protein